MQALVQRAAVAVALLGSSVAVGGESYLMRMADVHQDQIVFTYENDLWLVPSAGGIARRITNDPGVENWAKFSPDGTQLAFSGQYDGGYDVYVMDAEGGVPRRLTYHPGPDRVLGWFPDGKSVLFRSVREYPFRAEMIYKIPVDGGMPEKLPVDRGGLAAISPDGRQIAYNRISRESRTWKRHQGGTAQDIWVGSLDQLDYHRITDWPGSDNYPMWRGDKIYFNSDREYGTLNLYEYDVSSGQTRALTEFKDYDVKYPSLGVDEIVFQYGEQLHIYDLKQDEFHKVPVEIPSDLVRVRPEFDSISPTTGSFGLSPTGKRVLLEARGEIINLPADDGDPVNLTDSPGTREKNAAWSPDGRWIAFLSDKTGEEEIYLVDQQAEHPWRQVTHDGLGFRQQPVWSPDSKWLLFHDKFLKLNLVNAESGQITVVAQGEFDDAWERWGIQDYVWSPDSQWIAYTKFEQSGREAIFLYSLAGKESCRVTWERTQDWSPSFSPDGKYLYFLSNREFSPIMGFVDQNHVFIDQARPYLVILKDGEPSPFLAEDTLEPIDEEEQDDAEEQPVDEEDEADEAETKPTEPSIDTAGILRRIVVAPGVPAGNYFRLEATADGFLYLKKTEHEFSKYQTVTDETGGSLDLCHYNLKDKKSSRLMGSIANYHLSADRKQMIYRSGSTYGVVATGSTANVGDGKVDLGAVRIRVDRPAEFLQIFDEAWRIQRDWFYDPNMHAVPWQQIREKYRKFVPYCGNRGDLNYVIGEMIAELNIGHTYVSGGDDPDNGKHVAVGLLGADFRTAPNAEYYQIAHIIPSNPGDDRERSPFDVPGCPIREGQFLIAINDREVKTTDNVFAHLQNFANRMVTITYNDKPSADDAKTCRVQTIGSESAIRYREWVENNKAYVEKMSNGTIGYVHIPDMGENGLTEFGKYYYHQYYKPAMIIDERYNGGGFTGDMIIDRLERRFWAITAPREGKTLRDPENCFYGHRAVLVNEDTGSNGEFFAEAVKILKLAPVIGKRTWGGSIGIEPHQPLVDGGSVTPPQFGLYGLNREWLIEGHGVVPDHDVDNLPGDVVRGQDAQLDFAIQLLLKQNQSDPKTIPPTPPYPDKSKGIVGGKF